MRVNAIKILNFNFEVFQDVRKQIVKKNKKTLLLCFLLENLFNINILHLILFLDSMKSLHNI